MFLIGSNFPEAVMKELDLIDNEVRKEFTKMENKANKNTEVQYITAEQAADLYNKLEIYISEELENLQRMLLSEINETLLNWLNVNDLEKFENLKKS